MIKIMAKTNFIALYLNATYSYAGGGSVIARIDNHVDKECLSDKMYIESEDELASCNSTNWDMSAEIWGEAGRGGYVSAAKLMDLLHPNSKKLPSHVQELLYPIYGRTVYKVRIHWNAEPLDEWASNTFRIEFDDVGTVAQTFGYDIYMKFDEPEDCYEGKVMRILTHEIVHSQQFEKYGNSLSNFGYHYFKQYKLANLDYADNKLEVKANNKEQYGLYSCPI